MKKVEKTKEEKSELIENAGMELDDAELEMVSGGSEDEDYPWEGPSLDPLVPFPIPEPQPENPAPLPQPDNIPPKPEQAFSSTYWFKK